MWLFGLVLVAAGNSSRMGDGKSKIFQTVNGETVLARCLKAFASAEYIDRAVVVCREEDMEEVRRVCEGFSKPIKVVRGGASRQQSVFRGVTELRDADYYVIHDAARPLVTPACIDRICKDALMYKACAGAVRAKDTYKTVDSEGFVTGTPPRETLLAVQTPQVFEKFLYRKARDKAERDGREFTDDCQLIEHYGERVHLVEGDYRNIKITTPDDLLAASAYVGGQPSIRLGCGYDVHRLVPGRRLILGGVEIPYEKGLLGHSDADVLTHAVMDALLGAAGLGDIGQHFPDTDVRYEGANSMELLAQVRYLLKEAGYAVMNIDATICAQAPKLMPHVAKMKEGLAEACEISASQVNVKATTEEGLGITGEGAGMSATAVALLRLV